MRRILLIALCLAGCATVSYGAAPDEPYQKIRVPLPAGTKIPDVLALDRELELMSRGDGDALFLSRPSITQKLLDLGWYPSVLVPDLERFYAERQKGAMDYGIWHTYAETVAEMELLHSQFPEFTTAPFSIGTTLEGRTIWAMKISDNPNVQEDEPEILNDGMHHAREIMTVELLLYFMRYLCERYDSNPTIKFLVDNRQIYFVPLVNPDGFVFNEQIAPNGGGMWRKNRRPNAGGCYGVDINRNYPFQWFGPGSETDPCGETYRGFAPGSEAETQALMGFINAHNFIAQDSWHSVAGMILFPWGHTLDPTPDDAIFRAVAAMRAGANGYQTGQAPELLYSVNGGALDWSYGEQAAKPKIFAFTTEIGGTDFWPLTIERFPLITENLHSLVYLAQIAGPTAGVTDLALTDGNANGRLDPGEAANFVATVRDETVVPEANLENIVIRLRCSDPYVVLSDASSVVGTIAPWQTSSNDADPFECFIEEGCPILRQITFTVVVDAAGGIHYEKPYVFTVGEGSANYIAVNDFEDPGEEWVADGIQTATTGAFERIDPVATAWQPEDDATPAAGAYALITAQNPGGLDDIDDVDGGVAACHSPDYDLSGYAGVLLDVQYFFAQRDGGDDPTGDLFRFEASPNGGASWVTLTHHGDYYQYPIWQQLYLNLEDYIPLTNQVRFRIQAGDGSLDGDVIEAGIDDFKLADTTTPSRPPSAPSVYSPGNGAQVAAPLTLTVTNATDPESDPLTYGFRVYNDPDLTNLVASADGIPSGTTRTSWTTAPLALGVYYWRAFAADGTSRGVYCAASSFTVTSTVDAPAPAPPASVSLAAGPNPAPGSMQIRYFLPAVTVSRLAAYDPQGRLVREFEEAPASPGWHEIAWDARDDAGRRVANGTYWICLWTPGQTRTVRVVRIE